MGHGCRKTLIIVGQYIPVESNLLPAMRGLEGRIWRSLAGCGFVEK
jgi:hypothetical protein